MLLWDWEKTMKLQLINRKVETEDVETFVFNSLDTLNWQAGQYLHYILEHPNPDDRGIERWFTISSAPYEVQPSITTRFTEANGSTFKKALKQMQIGDFIEGDNPEGDFVFDETNQKHVFIAGGIGITPFRSMLLQLEHDKKPINVDLLYANRKNKLVFDELLTGIETKHPNFKIKRFIGENIIKGDDLQEYVDSQSIFYISGPRKMVEVYKQALKSFEVPDSRIKTDYFPGYQLDN